MKLKSFRIKNYKSIIDSGICWLTAIDNITVLAGQNESGKSSILQALASFDLEEIDQDALRDIDGATYPELMCNFTLEDTDLKSLFSVDILIYEEVYKVFDDVEDISIVKKFTELEKYEISLAGNIYDQLSQKIKKINEIANESELNISKYSKNKIELVASKHKVDSLIKKEESYREKINFLEDAIKNSGADVEILKEELRDIKKKY